MRTAIQATLSAAEVQASPFDGDYLPEFTAAPGTNLHNRTLVRSRLAYKIRRVSLTGICSGGRIRTSSQRINSPLHDRRAAPEGVLILAERLLVEHAHIDGRALLRSLPVAIRAQLPPRLREFRSSSQWSYLVKIHYGNRDLHYEASHRARLHTVEIGLHFEADDLTNARLLGAFRAHERKIRRKLPSARFEEWDRGWTRIWEPVVYERFDGALRDDLAERLAAYISVLEPVLRDELPQDVPWSP